MGHTLRDDAPADLPDSLRDAWTRRLDDVLVDVPASAAAALELGATLGLSFTEEEWNVTCGFAALKRVPAALDGLVRARLLDRVEAGWQLCHVMIREILLRRAESEGRLARWHAACAAALADLDADPARVGRHWFAAGKWSDAIDPSLAGLDHEARRGEPLGVLDLAGDVLTAMARAVVSESDPRWRRARLARAAALRELGRPEEAEVEERRAAAGAARFGGR